VYYRLVIHTDRLQNWRYKPQLLWKASMKIDKQRSHCECVRVEWNIARCNTFLISKQLLFKTNVFMSHSACQTTDRMLLWSRVFLKLGTTLADASPVDAGEHQVLIARCLGVVRNSLVSYRGMINPWTIAFSFKRNNCMNKEFALGSAADTLEGQPS
jgi:hypothetical protein